MAIQDITHVSPLNKYSEVDALSRLAQEAPQGKLDKILSSCKSDIECEAVKAINLFLHSNNLDDDTYFAWLKNFTDLMHGSNLAEREFELLQAADCTAEVAYCNE